MWWCKSVALGLWLALAAAVQISDSEKCTIRPKPDSAMSSGQCRMRTLDGDANALAALPADGVSELNITCNRIVLFESSISAKYFPRMSQLEELVVDGCRLLKLPADTFASLRSLKRLKIRTRNAEWGFSKNLELTNDTFAGLKGLDVLDMGDSNIKALPENVFCSVDYLQSLNLTRNRLRSSRRLGFGPGCGGNVHTLDLSHNEMHSLVENSTFSQLTRLHFLYLQHNNITDISGETFNKLVDLHVVNASYNRLETIRQGTFANCKQIREIYLNNNMLYELAKGVFHRLEQLLILNLANNQLSSNHIDDTTFTGLIRLIELHLSDNALTRIDGKTFKELFFLQILDLRNNSIGFIEENAFIPLYNLHTLNLAENRLHTIDQHLFNGLYVLSKLTLNNNLLMNIDRKAFKNCSDLKELDLSSNQITHVPEALWDLTFLKTLDLGENQISDFKNGSFKNLEQLTGLRLIDNQIGNITVGMLWDLPSLQVLNLARNKIQIIERGAFDRNTQLEAIRVDSNFISNINGVFSEVLGLLWLNLSENHLVWFDYAFVPSTLKWLDIHGNFIENLSNYYKIIEEIQIRTLDASHNRIREISSISIPNSAELVFINNNFIHTVQPNTFLDKVNLSRVDLFSNDISYLDLNSLRLRPVPPNQSLPELYIGGNTFKCDCDMEWLSLMNNASGQRQYPRVMDQENIMCQMTHSRGLSQLPLTSVSPSNFLCQYEFHCFALCHCCDFDACDCEMTCPRNCSCFHDQTWNTNVVDCSEQLDTEIPHKIPMDATEVYLDGNKFKELPNHVFIGRKNMRALFVNNSGVENIQNRSFAGLNSLKLLHLQDNRLTELKGYEFEYLNNLKELYLQNNVIEHIGNATFAQLQSLEILRLDGNRLVVYPIWQLNLNTKLNELSLGNNQWSCKCKFLQEFTNFVAENAKKVADINDVTCWNIEAKTPKKRQLDLNGTACGDYYSGSIIDSVFESAYLPMMVLSLCCFLLLVLAIVLMFIFRDSIRVWLFANYGIRLFSFGGAYEETEKLYDGYVCYSPKDEEFVIQAIAAELENGSPPFQLCLHYRDLPHRGSPYTPVSPVMLEAAEASKRVILVLTRNFLQTEWSRFEFRQALHEALKGRIFKLVLVEEGQIAPEAESDPDLRPYLKTGSRVRWGEKRFRERLRYAMPGAPKSADSRHHHHHHPSAANYRRNINTYTLDSSVAVAVAEPGKPAPPGAEAPGLGIGDRPHSDHIYSSIDSDYSTLERGARGWRAPSVQAYLV